MAAFLRFVFSQSGLLASLLIAAVWWARRPASRVGRRALIVVVAVYTLASIYCIPFGLSRVLVAGLHEFSPAAAPPGPTAIVVLGSGAVYLTDWSQRQLSFPDLAGAARVSEAARVFNLVPDAWIISSGGPVHAGSGAPTTGGAMRNALVMLGVPASRILVEGQSLSTRDEAMLTAPLLRSIGATHVILVTSDFHMRRSLATFRAAGIDAAPAIAQDPMRAHPLSEWVWPSSQAMLFSGSIVHEAMAFVLYTARGWM